MVSQVLPWESLPLLREQRVYRMPSLASTLALLAHCSQPGTDRWQDSTGHGRAGSRGRGQKLAVGKAGEAETDGGGAGAAIDPDNGFFLLNPGGDLEGTQAALEELFREQAGWKVSTLT